MAEEVGLFFTKLLPVFVYPVGLVVALFALAALLSLRSRPVAGRVIAGVAVGWLWIASTPSFSDWALTTLESQHPPREIAELPKVDAIVILGGAIDHPVGPRRSIDLSEAADRVLFATRLFKAGKAPRLLVTGGNLPWAAGSQPEALLIRDLLVEWGVSATAIEAAGRSRNTYENAREIAEIQARTPFRMALLVTSASHMPRAVAVFKKAGIPVVPAATDVQVLKNVPWTILRWLPDARALRWTTVAVKEWIGFGAYRLLGYV